MTKDPRMIRKLDEQGRITLPERTREKFGWKKGTELEVTQNIELCEVRLRLKRKLEDIPCAVCKIEPIVFGYLDKDTNIAVCHDCAEKIKEWENPSESFWERDHEFF